MSEEPTREGGEAAGESEDLTAMMDEVLEKLRLLNYEKEFLSNKGMKPLNKGYFVTATNQIEQFNYFKQLVKWLFTVNETQAGDYTKYDEPLTVSQNIQMELKKIGIEADFPPLKLKNGAGEEVLTVLLGLVNRGLKVKRFQFKPPRMEAPNKTEEAPMMEAEDTTNMELGAGDEEEIEEEQLEDNGEPQKQEQDDNADKNVLKSRVEEKEWILECERVAPKLKYQVAGETKEWRGHIETLKNFADNIKKTFPDTRARLEKISDDLSKTLERIAQRENSINVNLNELGTEYRSQMDDLKKLQQLYQQKTELVNDLKEKFKKADDALTAIQGKIDEHGSHATDSSPLVKIKEAIKNMRIEIAAIELRAGIVSHRVLAHMSKEKKEKIVNPKQKKGALNNVADQLDDLDD